jgi:hypothetical protein
LLLKIYLLPFSYFKKFIYTICTKNSVLTLLVDSFSPSLLDPQSESISSINIIAGLEFLDIKKSVLTNFSDSPCHLDIKSAEEIEKKVEFDSVATAFARYDLPVPGGP